MSAPTAPSEGTLGVVVLAYGAGGRYRALISSLLEEGVVPERVVIVHNPSRPDEPELEVPARCVVLRPDRNVGYARGMNLGIERQRSAGTKWILLLTHDARLRPGALEALLAAARRRPGFDVLAPTLVLSGTDRVFSYGGVTRRDGSLAHVSERPPEQADGVAPCDWVDGGTMLLRADLLERVGGFDERFWGYCEDADLCLRATRAGSGVGVVLAAEADQSPGGSKRPGAWAYLLTRNGLAHARRARGALGMAAFAGGTVAMIAANLLRMVLRRLGLRDGDPRESWMLVVGMTRGAADFLRSRWGPPPAGLPGTGDLQNAHP